ncbi:MAG: SDR family NAD(P)-dependent oxidoreductase [Bacteroidota bacterium]
MEYYTLITGSSHGIGKCMANECASRGMNIILVALDEPLLTETANELKASFPVKVEYLGIDLTAPDAAKRVYDWCEEQGLKVNVLINNAGLGKGGYFESVDMKDYLTIMKLNNQAMVELTYHFFNDLKSHAPSYILSSSSMEATLPLPYKAVYTGTKNFIYAFSLAIREELRSAGENVSVSILCPGPVLTNTEGLDRIKAHGKRSQLLLMMPEDVAKIAVKQMLRKKRVIIPGKLPWLIVKTFKFLPTALKMRILERVFRVYR